MLKSTIFEKSYSVKSKVEQVYKWSFYFFNISIIFAYFLNTATTSALYFNNLLLSFINLSSTFYKSSLDSIYFISYY